MVDVAVKFMNARAVIERKIGGRRQESRAIDVLRATSKWDESTAHVIKAMIQGIYE